MNAVDTAILTVSGGHGGPGSISFRKEKFIPKGGPDGGDGGHGGSVIIQADRNRQTLLDTRMKQRYAAQNGQAGRPRNQNGSAGSDYIIRVPCGTLIYNDATVLADLVTHEASICVAKGGKGGRGNSRFATAKFQTPRYAQPGLSGEQQTIRLEVALIAQIGLIGLPNAGKSTLLNALTGTRAKTAAYPFTTLYPNLGVLRYNSQEKIIADIPGLVAGAAAGVGLGNDFLRHIRRTHILVHLISLAQDAPEAVMADYHRIIKELQAVDLDKKPRITIFSQVDVAAADPSDYIRLFQAHGIQAQCISAVTGTGILALKRQLV